MITITDSTWAPYLQPSAGGKQTAKIDLLWPASSIAAKDPRLARSHLSLDALAALPANWDGHGSAKPLAQAIERARQLLEEGFEEADAIIGWQNPFISASEDGEVVLEWWNRDKKLTIYVGADGSTFLRSWGPHVINDMEDGVLRGNWDPEHWMWLFR